MISRYRHRIESRLHKTMILWLSVELKVRSKQQWCNDVRETEG